MKKRKLVIGSLCILLLTSAWMQEIRAEEPETFAEQPRDIRPGGKLRYAEAVIPYVLEGEEEAPDTAVLTVQDDDTGETCEREFPCMETKVVAAYWSDTFSFPVKIIGYDADGYLLGDTQLDPQTDLSAYGEELLDFLELSPEYYRVNQVDWLGEPYEENGILCRDAQAQGEKLLRSVEARYGGEVWMPNTAGNDAAATEETTASEEAATEIIISEIPETEPETIREEVEEIAEEVPKAADGLKSRLQKWLREHRIVVRLGLAFLIPVLIAILLLAVSGRKKEKRDT